MRNAITASLGIAVLVGLTVFPPPTVAGGVDDGLATCSYQYSRWQATRTAYWRDLYYVCATASNTADEPFD
jgi:hypothetical protein